MRRPILGSLLIMVLAVGVLAFGGTYAAFTDSQTASGDVNAAPAGSVDLRLDDVGPPCGITNISQDELTFESFENLLPGQFVTCSVKLVNIGTSPFDVDVTGADTSLSLLDVCDGAGNDFTISVANGADTGGDDPDADTARVAVGASQEAAITVTFNAGATNDCQGDAAFVSVKFTASSIP
jgi:predicted ribosomally synthesized peptide with SipW-like signal peptide